MDDESLDALLRNDAASLEEGHFDAYIGTTKQALINTYGFIEQRLTLIEEGKEPDINRLILELDLNDDESRRSRRYQLENTKNVDFSHVHKTEVRNENYFKACSDAAQTAIRNAYEQAEEDGSQPLLLRIKILKPYGITRERLPVPLTDVKAAQKVGAQQKAEFRKVLHETYKDALKDGLLRAPPILQTEGIKPEYIEEVLIYKPGSLGLERIRRI